MENYIVSARKYRPSTFETVVGQKALTETLRNAIRSNHLAHAYLFCGPRGVGKTTCARIFAKTINCLTPTSDQDACNQCESCRAFNENRSFNIHELDAASNNSVEDIRSIIDQVRIPPQIGKYSVYIIDEVHMLSAGAFNALLKTLEEPPSYAIFILATTEKHKVLPTILSRCQVFDFSRITIADTVHHLQYVAAQEGVQAEEEALHVVAQKADGGMRDALSIFDQLVTFCGNNISYQQAIEVLNVLDSDYYFRIVDAALATDVSTALLCFNDVLCKGFDAGHFLSGLASHMRDLLVSKDPATTVLLETSDAIRQHFAEQASKCAATWLFRALDIVNTADINYRTARNKRLTVEMMLVKLCTLLMSQAAPQAAVPAAPKAQPVAQPVQQPAAPKAQPVAQPVQQPAAPKAQPVAQPAAPATPQAQPIQQPAATIQPGAPLPGMAVIPGMPGMPGVPAATTIPGMPGMPGAAAMPGASASATTTSAAQPAAAATVEESRPFTAEQMANAWNRMRAALFSDDKRFNAVLSNIAITRIDDLNYQLPLVNQIQLEEMQSVRGKMLSFLRKELHNASLQLHLEVVEQEHSAVAYTADERLKVLTDINPQLTAFRQSFSLTLD